MTGIIFIVNEKQILLAADTLCLDANRVPQAFSTKVLTFPRLNTMVVGSGSQNIVTQFSFNCSCNPYFNDYDSLIEVAPTGLRQLIEKDENWQSMFLSSIYTLGYSKQEQRFRAHVFKVEDDFIAKPIEECCHPPLDSIPKNKTEILKAMIKLNQKYPEFVGGEIEYYRLTSEGFYSSVIHRFADYADIWKKIKQSSN
jgi:hypothetical protein